MKVELLHLVEFFDRRLWTHHHPAVETDAEGQVDGRDHQQSPESLQQQRHQAHLEHVGVEHHQQDDDDVEQDADVLNAAATEEDASRGKIV